MIVVLFGPPGAGKGTQSQLVSKRFNLTHVSTGDLLRAAIKGQTALGVEAKKFVDAGELVPDAVMIGLIKDLMTANSSKGFLFDGFPRTVDQAKAFEAMLMDSAVKLQKAIFLEVPRPLLLERLTGRRVCGKCGTAFHVSMKPSKVSGICDVCGGPLEQRKDDRAEVIENRLEVYDKSTRPLKTYYQEASKFVVVDGTGEPGAVFHRISDVLT